MNETQHPTPLPRIALLLKAPRSGMVKTRLAATVGEANAIAIYRHLTEWQLRALPHDWQVTVYYDPPDGGEQMAQWLDPLHPGLHYGAQCPGDLGARLTAAFAAEFSHAPGPVFAIGGDCPGLDGMILESAAQAMKISEVVLGPAVDGGYYLIGLKAPQPDLFAGIAWSTPAVLGQTREKVRAAGLRASELPVLEDVDDAGSWARVVNNRRASGWAQVIHAA